jgi:tRNA pseudouridine55 synthase
MKSLLRTRVGTFSIENSRKLSEITELVQQDKLMDVVIKVDDMFPDYAKIYVAEEYCKYIYNGNSFKEKDLIQKDLTQKDLTQKDLTQDVLIQKVAAQKESEVLRIDSSLVRVYDYRNNFIGIYEFDDTIKQFNPVKMFLS